MRRSFPGSLKWRKAIHYRWREPHRCRPRGLRHKLTWRHTKDWCKTLKSKREHSRRDTWGLECHAEELGFILAVVGILWRTEWWEWQVHCCVGGRSNDSERRMEERQDWKQRIPGRSLLQQSEHQLSKKRWSSEGLKQHTVVDWREV